MTRRLHYGRPGTQAVPADWQAQVSPAIDRQIDATGCSITIAPAGSSPHWDDTAGRTVTSSSTTVYTGAADVVAMSDTDQVVEAALQELATRLYVVQIPLDAAGADQVARNQVIHIDTNPDPALAGKTMVIQSVVSSSRRLSRVMHAILDD